MRSMEMIDTLYKTASLYQIPNEKREKYPEYFESDKAIKQRAGVTAGTGAVVGGVIGRKLHHPVTGAILGGAAGAAASVPIQRSVDRKDADTLSDEAYGNYRMSLQTGYDYERGTDPNRWLDVTRMASETADELEKEAGAFGNIMGGLLGAAARQYRQGNVTGREQLYHGTDADSARSIREQGILKSRANDPESFTRKILLNDKSSIKPEELNDLVYLGKNKNLAKNVATNAWAHNEKRTTKFPNVDVVKVNAPVGSFKEVANPELRGAKNGKELGKTLLNEQKMRPGLQKLVEPLIRPQMNAAHKALGEQTKVVPEDIPTKWIKGSKDYVKVTPKEVARFAAKNPGRFAKGVAPGLAAAGLTAAELASLLLKKAR